MFDVVALLPLVSLLALTTAFSIAISSDDNCGDSSPRSMRGARLALDGRCDRLSSMGPDTSFELNRGYDDAGKGCKVRLYPAQLEANATNECTGSSVIMAGGCYLYADYQYYTIDSCDDAALRNWRALAATSRSTSKHIVILGGVLGGVGALGLLVVVLLWRKKRKRRIVERHGKVEEIALGSRGSRGAVGEPGEHDL